MLALVGEAQDLPSGGYGTFLLESLLILAGVCLLAWVVLRYGLRRFGAGGHGPMKVVARLPLEPRRTLYVIEVAGKSLLVGVGDGAMQTLAELDPAKVAEAVERQPPTRSFLEVLRQVTARKSAPAADTKSKD